MTENQINEMFRLMTTTIKKIDGLEGRFDGLENKFEESEERDAVFRAETKQTLGEIKQELRFMNRKIEVQIEDLVNTKVKVRDHEERIRVLEEEKEVA